MVKILVIQYLYNLSDERVMKRLAKKIFKTYKQN
ncbi:transposase [Evansella sp. AB-rgal1]